MLWHRRPGFPATRLRAADRSWCWCYAHTHTRTHAEPHSTDADSKTVTFNMPSTSPFWNSIVHTSFTTFSDITRTLRQYYIAQQSHYTFSLQKYILCNLCVTGPMTTYGSLYQCSSLICAITLYVYIQLPTHHVVCKPQTPNDTFPWLNSNNKDSTFLQQSWAFFWSWGWLSLCSCFW